MEVHRNDRCWQETCQVILQTERAELVSLLKTLSRSECLVISDSCAIEDRVEQFLYLTGGDDQHQVTRYSPSGSAQPLPRLLTGRYDHACAGYRQSDQQLVLLVVGGKTGTGSSRERLSSTEIYDPSSSKGWRKVSATLPHSIVLARATTVRNKIYLLGECQVSGAESREMEVLLQEEKMRTKIRHTTRYTCSRRRRRTGSSQAP